MSVLFIGEKNMGNYHSPYFSNHKNEISFAKRQRKIKQQQYRLELFGQMREKQERIRRQRENDHIFNRRYERIHTEQPALQFQENYSKRALSFQKRQPEDNSFESNMQKIRKRQTELQYQYPNVFGYQQRSAARFEESPFQKLRKNKFEQRIRTQNMSDRERLESIVVDLEKRRQQLNQYDNKKIEQVYERMNDSVRKLGTQNSYESSLPLKQSFQKKDYKEMFTLPKYSLNPEDQEGSHSKLPPISKSNNSRQEKISQSEKNWKQWYAKQKLRQLESYYRKLTIKDQASVGFQSSIRPRTPLFQQRN